MWQPVTITVLPIYLTRYFLKVKIHYAMPVRSMLYDALRYTRQCKSLEREHRRDGDLKDPDEFLSGRDIDWETMAAIGAATGSAKLVDYALERKGGRLNMCTALENLVQEGVQEGMQASCHIIKNIKGDRDCSLPPYSVNSKFSSA